MRRNSRLIKVLAMIFVGVGLTLAGCGTKKAEQTALHPVYGVADLETLVKSHPKYSEYFRLETEYSHLVEKYKTVSYTHLTLPTILRV